MNTVTLIKGLLGLYAICSLTAMAPMNLSFLLLLAASIYSFFIRSQSVGFNAPDDRRYRFWALALLISCWGSLVIAHFFPFSYADHSPEITFHGFLKIWYLVIPVVFFYAHQILSKSEPNSLLTIIKPWWIATVCLAGIATIQFFTGWPYPQVIPHETHFYHATLFFGHHLSTASILIFPTFTALSVAMGFHSRTEKKMLPLPLRFAWLVGLAGVLILFLSYARTAWIALLIGMVLLVKKYVLHRLNRKQWLAGATASVIALGLLTQTPMVKERIERLYGVNERLELWKANIDFFVHRPLTGIGWLKTQEMSEFYFKSIDPEHYRDRFWGHAHSNIFEMLGGTGLLGLFAFLGWSFFTLRFAHRLSGKLTAQGDFFYGDFAFGIFIALILLHFNGLTNVTFWEGKVMHQQMLALGMLLILTRKLVF